MVDPPPMGTIYMKHPLYVPYVIYLPYLIDVLCLLQGSYSVEELVSGLENIQVQPINIKPAR